MVRSLSSVPLLSFTPGLSFRPDIRQNCSMPELPKAADPGADHFSTIEVARLLGMAVRSVQLMVDRGELEAWKTPGGHRRISRDSVQRWREARQGAAARPAPPPAAAAGDRKSVV
jgi:excisionase family DNA binding protein